ncbi:hypothetical protein D3C80_1540130 [compost metagenome]
MVAVSTCADCVSAVTSCATAGVAQAAAKATPHFSQYDSFILSLSSDSRSECEMGRLAQQFSILSNKLTKKVINLTKFDGGFAIGTG